MKTSSLPTLFYFFNKRTNWKLCYKLSDDSWVVLDYISIHKCSRMLVHCAKLGIEARACVRGSKSKSLILLNSFYIRLSGRRKKK